MDSKSRRPKRPRKKVVLIPRFNFMFSGLYLTVMENFAQIIWMKQSIGKPGAIGPTSEKIEHIKFLASFDKFRFKAAAKCDHCQNMAEYFYQKDGKFFLCCSQWECEAKSASESLHPICLGVFLGEKFSSLPAKKELSDFFKKIFNLEKASAKDIYDFLVSQCSPKHNT